MGTNRRLSGAAALLSALASTNAAGQVSNWANPVSGVWTDATKWDSGIPLTPMESAVFGHSGIYAVTVNANPSLAELTVSNPEALLIVPAGNVLGVTGPTMLNNGQIQFNPSGSSSNVLFIVNGPVTLNGTGEFQMRTQGANDTQITGAGILTNGADHTIRGVGYVQAGMVNDGTIAADIAVSVSGSQLVVLNDVANNSLMEGRASSELVLSGVTIDQTLGGSLIAHNTGNITVASGNTDILFGTIETAGNGEFNVEVGATATLSGVVNNGTIDLLRAAAIVVDGAGLENNGVIDMNRAGSASNAVFHLSESADLSGTGILNMKTQGADDSQLNTAVGAVLTHGVDHEIRGVGYINAELVNNGIVTADVAVSVIGNGLVMQGGPKANNNLMIAATGSILQFSGVTLDQTGGGELVTTGGEIRLANTTVLSGVYNTFGGFVRSQGGTNTLSGLLTNGQIIVDPASTVLVDGGGMINNGEIQMNQIGSASDSVLRFTETADLLGTGELQMRTQGASDTQFNSDVGVTVTHGASHLIRGVGYIGAAIVNNGEIRADASVSVSGNGLVLQTNNKVNNGLMVAGPSSILLMSGIAVDQTGGGMIVAEEGDVWFSTANITGGIYQATGSGKLTTTGGTSRVSGMTFDGPSVVSPATALEIGTGGLVNNGVLELNPTGSGSNAVVFASDSVGLSGTGEIRMRTRGADDSQLNTSPGMTITHGANHTIRGVGFINAAMINNGTISADVSVSVSGSALSLRSQNKTNAGLMTAEVSSVLGIEGVTLTQTGTGSIVANNGSVVFSSGATLVSGSLNSTGTGSYTVSGATFDGVTVNASGTVSAGTSLNVAGSSLANNGRMVVNPGFSASDGIVAFAGSSTINGTGEINLATNGADSRFTSAGTITNGAGHTVSGRGQIQAPFVNEGFLAPGTNDIATMSATAGVTFGAGGTYRVEINDNSMDRISVTGTVTLGGTLDLDLGAGADLTNNTGAIIVSCTSVTGTFSAVNHLQSGNLITRVVYEPTQVRVLVRCIADTNLDGAVTAADFSAWITAFNTQTVVADQNLDGNVSPADFSAWIANFNQGCP